MRLIDRRPCRLMSSRAQEVHDSMTYVFVYIGKEALIRSHNSQRTVIKFRKRTCDILVDDIRSQGSHYDYTFTSQTDICPLPLTIPR
jgi:2,3-bisphosphoglycerate-independent phosphoglycerate mutase